MPLNIFDWNGRDFLSLYMGLLFAFTIIGAVSRHFLRSPFDEPRENTRLEPSEVAYLAGGPVRTVDAAVSKLVTADLIAVENGKLKSVVSNPPARDSVEKFILNSAISGRSISETRRGSVEATTPVRERLSSLGFLPDGAGSLLCRIGGFLLLLLLIAGIIKTGIGISRDKPVLYLVFLEISTLIPLVLLIRAPRRSRRGDQMLVRVERENSALQHALTSGASLAPHDLGFAIGLYGLSCLSGSQHQDLRNDLMPPPSGPGYSCATGFGSSCSSGSSGGCGGGGGGGGSGGCGGCGSSS